MRFGRCVLIFVSLSSHFHDVSKLLHDRAYWSKFYCCRCFELAYDPLSGERLTSLRHFHFLPLSFLDLLLSCYLCLILFVDLSRANETPLNRFFIAIKILLEPGLHHLSCFLPVPLVLWTHMNVFFQETFVRHNICFIIVEEWFEGIWHARVHILNLDWFINEMSALNMINFGWSLWFTSFARDAQHIVILC